MTGARARLALAGALLLAALAGGCGGSGPAAGTATSSPAASAPGQTTASVPAPVASTAAPPAVTATTPAPAATTTTPAPTRTQATPAPGGGDEQPIRVPATFTFSAGRLTPPVVSVPSFLTVQITVVAADGRAHRVLVRTPHGVRTLHVAAGGRAGLLLPGRKGGSYALVADGGATRASVVFGAEPGP